MALLPSYQVSSTRVGSIGGGLKIMLPCGLERSSLGQVNWYTSVLQWLLEAIGFSPPFKPDIPAPQKMTKKKAIFT